MVNARTLPISTTGYVYTAQFYLRMLKLAKQKAIENLTYNVSAHVLLYLLKELTKSDKMRGLSSILSLFFRNEFTIQYNKSMNVRFFLPHYIKICKNRMFSVKCQNAAIFYASL